MSGPTDASAWVSKADHDLLSIANNLASTEVPWDVVVFNAQQAAEKLLKAFLVSRGRKPPKIHDLTRLLALCIDDAPDCTFLSPIGERSRYPDNEAETAREDAERGVDIARRIRVAVLALIEPKAQ